MARRLDYLNHCWNIVNWTLGNKLQWNFNPNSNIFIQKNAFENVVCEMASICLGLNVLRLESVLLMVTGMYAAGSYVYRCSPYADEIRMLTCFPSTTRSIYYSNYISSVIADAVNIHSFSVVKIVCIIMSRWIVHLVNYPNTRYSGS